MRTSDETAMAKILLVDDDPITLKVVGFVLRAGGHSIQTAPDGFTAMEMLKQERFELVVSDVNMPGGFSGFRLVEAMKDDPNLKNIPAVLLSVRGAKNDVARARKAGADHFFVKPIHPEAFRAKIGEILAKLTPAIYLGETPVREKALWTSMLQVTHVCESGLRIDSPVPLPEAFEFCFASNVFHALGITTPQMRVTSCEPSSLSEGLYTLKLDFIELSDADQQAVRQWLHSQKKISA